MLSRYLLCMFCALGGVFSRAIPDVSQERLLAEQQTHAKPEHKGVMIAFKRSGDDHEATLQFPLQQRLSGSVLHKDPWSDVHKAIDSMKIVAVLDVETAMPRSVEELATVRCRIEPDFSAEEVSAASASGVELGVWPSFGVEDGVIIFNRSDSRWFLAGRSIKSVECW